MGRSMDPARSVDSAATMHSGWPVDSAGTHGLGLVSPL